MYKKNVYFPNQYNYNYYYRPKKNNLRLNFTHYFCLPIETEGFQKEYTKLIDDLIKRNIKFISPYLFQRNDKLHLTLFLISADDKKIESIESNLSNLQNGIKEIINDHPLKFVFEKFDKMGDYFEQTRVVYAKPKDDENMEKFNKILNILLNSLINENLISKEEIEKSHLLYDESSKSYKQSFHMTICNINFIKSNNRKQYFDSRELLNELNSRFLPESEINNIYLCKLKTENGVPYNIVHKYDI